jgi:tetratricopeptide (TPR) repeat protein
MSLLGLTPCLLVFDNVNQLKDVVPYTSALREINISKIWHTLITSRDSTGAPDGYLKITLEPFSPDEGVKYLSNYIGKDITEEEANQLNTILDGFPLALTQAAHAIKEGVGMTPNKYIKNFQKNSKSYLNISMPADDPHQKNIFLTVKGCVDSLKESVNNYQKTLSIMEACSFLHPTQIPIDFLEKYFHVLYPDEDFDKYLRPLFEFGLIYTGNKQEEYNKENRSVTTHRLTQLVYRICFLENKEETISGLLINFRNHYYESKTNSAPWYDAIKNLSIHFQSLWDNVQVNLNLNNKSLTLGNRQPGKHLIEINLSAEPAFKTMSTHKLSAVGLIHDLLKILAVTEMRISGRAAEAEKHYINLLNIAKDSLGENHWGTALALNDLGIASGDLGKVDEQEKIFNEVLKILRKCFGEEDWRVAMVYDELGNICCAKGNPKAQKEYLQKSLAITEDKFAENTLAIASTLHNLGIANNELGNFHEGKTRLNQSLKIYEENFGKEHWRITITIHALANATGYLDGMQAKRELLKVALRINKSHFGEDHWYTAFDYHDLANTYEDDKVMQENLLLKSKDIISRHFTENGWCTAIVDHSLGVFYIKQGFTQKGVTCLEKAYPIIKKQFGENHWRTAMSEYRLCLAKNEKFNDKFVLILSEHFKGSSLNWKDYSNITLDILALPLLNSFSFDFLQSGHEPESPNHVSLSIIDDYQSTHTLNKTFRK